MMFSGDVVKCVDNSEFEEQLTLGTKYTVLDSGDEGDEMVCIHSDEGRDVWFFWWRFVKVSGEEDSMNERPQVRSEEYFKYMGELIAKVEAKLPITVIGFTDYSRVAFYWIRPDGTQDYYQNTMGFGVFEALAKGE